MAVQRYSVFREDSPQCYPSITVAHGPGVQYVRSIQEAKRLGSSAGSWSNTLKTNMASHVFTLKINVHLQLHPGTQLRAQFIHFSEKEINPNTELQNSVVPFDTNMGNQHPVHDKKARPD